MAEAFGTALAVVGLLGQMFDGCVKAYGYFTTAANMDQESQRLVCKVRIEEMRLVVWGREWGVAEGRLEEHLKEESNPRLRALATQIMTELYNTVTDFQRLQEKYGLVDQAAAEGRGAVKVKEGKEGKESPSPASSAASTPAPSRMGSELGSSSRSPRAALETVKSWKREVTLRTRWVIGDKDKFQTLLGDLKDFNDGLEQLFPASRLPSLHRAWRYELLESAQQDIGQLALLEKASNGVYPQLNASANLKKLRINLDAAAQSAFRPTIAFKVPLAKLTFPSCDGSSPVKDAKRSQGFHTAEGDVLVEWVPYDRDDPDARFLHLRRLDDLARVMRSASHRHPDLRAVDCLGYADDAASERYGLVYRAPAPSHDSLHALIASGDLKTPDLGARVGLAAALAVALWSLHSLDWLHKSLCSANVLFFPSAASATATSSTLGAALVPDVARPWLVGFGASRPELDAEMSVAAPARGAGGGGGGASAEEAMAELHRHPASVASGLGGRRPYCKAHDVYSLGLVLLEIGLWKVLQTYHKPHYSAERWRDKVILPVLVPGLGSKTGRLYREVVEKCLTAPEDMTSREAGELMESVVATLESIKV